MKQNNLTEAQIWLRRARSNLLLAQKGKRRGILLEDLCFNAQQAAEKALKAVCIFRELDFPKTHSLVRLLDILAAGGVQVPEAVQMADILTQYAVQTRYPGPIEEVTPDEYTEAVALAAKVVFWAEEFVQQKS